MFGDGALTFQEFIIARTLPLSTIKSGTDWRDIALLLLNFPELKAVSCPVRERLDASGVGPAEIAAWNEIVAAPIVADEDEDRDEVDSLVIRD